MVDPNILWIPKQDEHGIWRLDPDASELYDGRPLRNMHRRNPKRAYTPIPDNRTFYAVRPELDGWWTFPEIAALLGSTDVKVRIAYYEWSGKQPDVIEGRHRLTTKDAIYGAYDRRLRCFRRADNTVHLRRIIARAEASWAKEELRAMHRDAIRIVCPADTTQQPSP